MVGVHRFIEISDQLLLVSILFFLNKTKLTGWQLNWLLDHTKDMVIPPEIGPKSRAKDSRELKESNVDGMSFFARLQSLLFFYYYNGFRSSS